MKTLLLIDANSLIRRFFHALPPLTNSKGEPTQALYGLANILLKMWREGNPEYAAALFDRAEPTFRKAEYEDYKAHRAPAPEGLKPQLEKSRTLFEDFGIRAFEQAGLEADDLIATLAAKFQGEPELQIVVLTGDTDLFQLVEGSHIVVRTFKVGVSDTVLYDEPAVAARYGLSPQQILDYKALVGDPSDNIKGIPGVGPKTAASLLQRHGSLEKLFADLSQEPKLAEKLGSYREQVELAKRILSLRRDANVPIESIEDLRVREFDRGHLERYFREQGFETLLKRLNGPVGQSPETGPAKKKKGGLATRGLFDLPPVADKAERATASLSAEGTTVFIMEEPEMDDPKLAKPGTLKVGFGLKELLKKAWDAGRDVAPPYYDLSVAYWLLHPDLKEYDPDSVFKKFFKRTWKGDRLDWELALDWSTRKLDEYAMRSIFEDIEMPLMRVLAQMERDGIALSSEALSVLEKDIDLELEQLTAEIHRQAGEEFNLNSPRQLGRVLFEKLGLKPKLRKSTGHLSTNAEVLAGLVGEHPIIPLLLEYREDFKIQSTYVRPLQELAGSDGRLHTRFIQTGTGTGRLSSQSPNLQNVPQGSKWSKQLRSAFRASPGMSLVSFDYSQLELRLLAAVSGDSQMQRAFSRGDDIHNLTASKILGVKQSEVTSAQRRLAKVLNFGLVYGMGTLAFAKASGVSRKEAQRFIAEYFKQFSQIQEWQEAVKQEVRAKGFVQTLTGRRRYFPGIRSPLSYVAAEAERAVINHPIQGLEADVLKLAMIRVRDRLEQEGTWAAKVRLLLSIHDELLFEVSDDMINETVPSLAKIMEGVYPSLSVPLKVDIAVGSDWGHMTKRGSAAR